MRVRAWTTSPARIYDWARGSLQYSPAEDSCIVDFQLLQRSVFQHGDGTGSRAPYGSLATKVLCGGARILIMIQSPHSGGRIGIVGAGLQLHAGAKCSSGGDAGRQGDGGH
jgi:hypothetical protein